MPDYASNRLTISGPEERLIAFLEENKGRDRALSFSAAVPYPEVFERLDRARKGVESDQSDTAFRDRPQSGYNLGGYEWCIMSWGTKWDACDPKVDPYDPATGSITIRFCTASSSPLPWLSKVASRWPDLTFRLVSEEPSWGWSDDIGFREGQKVTHRKREVEDWVEDEDNGDISPVWGPWRDAPVDPIWDGWTPPEVTPDRAMGLKDGSPYDWLLFETLGILPGEERLLLEWLKANHPDRIALLTAKAGEPEGRPGTVDRLSATGTSGVCRDGGADGEGGNPTRDPYLIPAAVHEQSSTVWRHAWRPSRFDSLLIEYIDS